MRESGFAGPSAGSALGAAKSQSVKLGQSGVPTISFSPGAKALAIEGAAVTVGRMHALVAK
jgi:hypothetical protein